MSFSSGISACLSIVYLVVYSNNPLSVYLVCYIFLVQTVAFQWVFLLILCAYQFFHAVDSSCPVGLHAPSLLYPFWFQCLKVQNMLSGCNIFGPCDFIILLAIFSGVLLQFHVYSPLALNQKKTSALEMAFNVFYGFISFSIFLAQIICELKNWSSRVKKDSLKCFWIDCLWHWLSFYPLQSFLGHR